MTAHGRRLSVLVIDNDDNVHRSLRALTISHPHLVEHVSTAHGVDELRERPLDSVDAVVLDFWLDRDSRASVNELETMRDWKVPIILYTSEERPYLIRTAVAAGISGLCLKHDGLDALVHALACLQAGEPRLSRHLAAALDGLRPLQARLTRSEAQVLRGLAYGLEAPDIAARLSVGIDTVRTHEKHIHDKYRTVLGDGRVSRSRTLRAALEDGYWDAREWDEPWNIPS